MNNSSLQSDLEMAIDAHANDRLLEWTIKHLQRDDRNVGIADDIKKRKIVKAVLVEYPLALLNRVEGPQGGEAEPEPIHTWVERVGRIEQVLQTNQTVPPIIVTDFWNKIVISDGNHRHEALLKQGYEKYWTIFLFTKHESHEQLGLKRG